MPTRPFAAIAAVSTLFIGAAEPAAKGAAMAYDDASNPIYALDWTNGQNGGFGFGTWMINPNPDTADGGAFAATSQNNGQSGFQGNIDTGGRAWGLYGNVPATTITDAVRLFTPGGVTGDSTLGIGEKFILRMDNGFIANGGAVGFGLRNSLGENRFEFYFSGGGSKYRLDIDSDVFTLHGITYAGMTLAFTLTGPDTFSLDINYALGSPSFETFTGTLQGSPGSGIDRFRLFNFGAGTGGTNVYFNNAQVVPEPSAALLLAAGALALCRCRSRS
jgi:hypothetical protein